MPGEDRVQTINLCKGHAGFGFNIVGGVDRPYFRSDGGIFVSKIRADGAAIADGRLKRGDKIISVRVNGRGLYDICHNDAVNLLKNLKGTIKLDIIPGDATFPAVSYFRSRTPSSVSSISEKGSSSGLQTVSSYSLSSPTHHNGHPQYVGGSERGSGYRTPSGDHVQQIVTPERASTYRPREAASGQSNCGSSPRRRASPFSNQAAMSWVSQQRQTPSDYGDLVDSGAPYANNTMSSAPSLTSLSDELSLKVPHPGTATPYPRKRVVFPVHETVYTCVGVATVCLVAYFAYRRFSWPG